MRKNGRELKAKQMVSMQSDETIDKAMSIIGEVWYEMQWLERAGALFVIPKLLKANHISSDSLQTIEKITSEANRLKSELAATESLAAARLPQIEAEKKRSEELQATIRQLKKDLQTQSEQVRTPPLRPADWLATSGNISEDLFGVKALMKASMEEGSSELIPPRASTTPRTPLVKPDVDESVVLHLQLEIENLKKENAELANDVSDLTALHSSVGSDEPVQKLAARIRLLKKEVRREKKQRQEAQNLLDSVRDKCVAFYEKQKMKRKAIESSLNTEKSLRESQDAELKLLREAKAATDAATLACGPLQDEEFSTRVNIIIEEMEANASILSERLRDHGDSPPHTWEDGSPTVEEMAEQDPRDATVTIRMNAATGIEYTTVLVITDTAEVKTLIKKACSKMSHTLGTELYPVEHMLKVTQADDKALNDWLDHDGAQEVLSTLFSPRLGKGRENKSAKGIPEFPYSSRPIRSMAFVHEKYFGTDTPMRLWFTLQKQPLGLKAGVITASPSPSPNQGSKMSFSMMVAAKQVAQRARTKAAEKDSPPSQPSRARRPSKTSTPLYATAGTPLYGNTRKMRAPSQGTPMHRRTALIDGKSFNSKPESY
eukprot:TRINITY_DN10518_c0_g1_i1.p1 TRINITY_DN10518_c0_g1~~TRINITY_DN10518_c0_g1_i1.p1  ORF type:complete len:685 (+),score=155.73 TRINITY_DN10518_c0_g1_i1:248-2056(+)